eukprot:29747-Eustigmatos_ZCMA.PRE.1
MGIPMLLCVSFAQCLRACVCATPPKLFVSGVLLIDVYITLYLSPSVAPATTVGLHVRRVCVALRPA